MVQSQRFPNSVPVPSQISHVAASGFGGGLERVMVCGQRLAVRRTDAGEELLVYGYATGGCSLRGRQ